MTVRLGAYLANDEYSTLSSNGDLESCKSRSAQSFVVKLMRAVLGGKPSRQTVPQAAPLMSWQKAAGKVALSCSSKETTSGPNLLAKDALLTVMNDTLLRVARNEIDKELTNAF